MRPPYLLRIRRADNVHPRPHHVRQPRSSLLQRPLNILQSLHRLRIRIPYADNFSLRVRRRRAGYPHVRPHTHRPRIPNHRLPRRSARNICSRHQVSPPLIFAPTNLIARAFPFSIFTFPFSAIPFAATLRIKSRPQFRRHNRTQIVALAKHAITNPRDEVINQIAHPPRHHAQNGSQHPPPTAQPPKNMQERRGPHQHCPIAHQHHHAIGQPNPPLRRHLREKRRALQRRKPKRPPARIMLQNKLHRVMTQPAMSIVKKIFRSRRASLHRKSIARAAHTPALAAAATSPRVNRNYGNAAPFPLATVSENL
jgi:hypothetical protein